ncbi:MAG: ATP-binding protein [Gammaproteobacteria bacterium]|nr:ATP-binding protein [Gammaproteobacteria bacterium]MDH5799657.1 ATP-binding protein [Gammaproteobacteria bacterium]
MITSIRSRLLITLLITIISVSSITLTLSYFDANNEVQELFDAQLAQTARVLQVLLLPEVLQGKNEVLQRMLQQADVADYEEGSPFGHAYELKIAFQLWNRSGERLLKSASAPKQDMFNQGFSNQTRGYADVELDGSIWRVFNLWDESGTYLVQTAERYDIRNELVADISDRLVTPALISLPVIGLMIWLGIGRGLAPLKKVAAEVTQRDPSHLQPMETSKIPGEIVPLVTELNTLFIQVQQAFEKERRFTDDAAHELRTPLASLKTQVQVALRATQDQERVTALQQLLSGVDRAGHLVEQMLTLARLNPENIPLEKQSINLHNLCAEVIAQLAPKAFRKGINISLGGDEQILVQGDEISFSILVNNLVDNAIRYTPEDGDVHVQLERGRQGVRLMVEDNGPGIPDELRIRVFDRFYRALGTEASGCGLGLAIVKQISELYGIGVELHNRRDSQGLQALLTFRV